MLKPAIITTVRHNVGDDFVREGILHLLESLAGPVEPRLIHKHLPVTVRPEFDWLQRLGLFDKLASFRPNLPWRLSSVLDRLPLNPRTDKVLTGDLLIQSGAPIFWLNDAGDCTQSEWWNPIIEKRWRAKPARSVFWNLAGGTCQPYHSDGEEFAAHPEILDFARRLHDLAEVTTARDDLTARIFALAGRDVPVLPCTSIFAIDRFGITPQPGEYLALNYMPGAGHYPLGQPIDASQWERLFVEFARSVASRAPCLLVCHNQTELRAARALLPEIPTFHSRHHEDYLACYSRALGGIVNRVHAGFALASLGKPAAVIGADTRARMAAHINVPHQFVSEITLSWLSDQADRILAGDDSVATAMIELKNATRKTYQALLAGSLATIGVKIENTQSAN